MAKNGTIFNDGDKIKINKKYENDKDTIGFLARRINCEHACLTDGSLIASEVDGCMLLVERPDKAGCVPTHNKFFEVFTHTKVSAEQPVNA
jgi:hypothetical protein